MPVFLRWFLRLGPTNPITVRLVQNGSRRTKHMYVRAAYLAVLIATLLWLLLRGTGSALSYRELAMSASGAFEAISYLQIFLICVLAPVFMAGAIAQESSPRTWEVLLTTPLTAVQIVLGNLCGRLFFVVALLAASLPLFALTQYFGGVPGSSIFLSYLIAASAALLVGAIAIALAVSRVAGKRAVFVFYVAVVSYLAVTIAFDAFLRQSRGSPGVTVVTALNPFLTLRALLNPSTYPKAPAGSQVGIFAWLLESPVRTWCVGSSLLSVVFMLGSTLTVRAGGLQTLAAGSGRVPWYRKIFGFGAAGAEHRPPRSVWHNPIAWREGAARNATLGKTIARWSFVAMGGVFGAVLVVLYHAGNLTHSSFQLAMAATVGAELAVITLVAINTAGTAISREREDGTLDLLLTTPITASAYLWGKLRGLVAYLLPLLAVPLGTLLIAGLYVMAGGMGREGGVEVTMATGVPRAPGSPPGMMPVLIPESGLFAPLAVIPFVAFCVMVGLNWSLRMKGTIGSVVATVGVVGAIAGVVGLCGWQSGRGIPVVGPAVAAMSPASLLAAVIDPSEAMSDTVSRHGLGTARISLAAGCVVAGLIWAAVCYGIHSNMVRTFDMTVRKLAGQK